MKKLTVGFKKPEADLHKKSPKIFWISLISGFAGTAILIHLPFTISERSLREKVELAPVVIKLTNIPKTRHVVMTAAPVRPFIPGAMPIEVDDEFIPDEITIEDTSIESKDFAPAPTLEYVEDTGAAAEEEEIFELFAVDEKPERISNVVPEYPRTAERAGIEGSVYLKVLVNKEGMVDSVLAVSGPKIFYKTSIDAAKKTRFIPAKHNDQPVACWVYMPFKFEFEE